MRGCTKCFAPWPPPRGSAPWTPARGHCPLDPRGNFAPSNDLPWSRPCLLTLKWHILADDHSYTMLFEGGTPLNNPPIEIHTNSLMFALIFWLLVTIFYIFWLHEWLKWRLEFNSKSLFWCQSRQFFEVRAIEQRHHEFQLIHMPPHQFSPQYHSDGLSPLHACFEFFSKQICNVEALICHFYKNIITLTQIHFPRDAHIFRICTIFYRHYKGLHQMRKDLVLCAL